MRALIDSHADLEAMDDRCVRPLHLACVFDRDAEGISLLLERRAFRPARDIAGATPFTLAAMGNSHVEVLKLLTARGADTADTTNTDLFGWTPRCGAPL